MLKYILVMLALLFSQLDVAAQPVVGKVVGGDPIIIDCKITPSFAEDESYLGGSNILKHNNLRRDTGKATFAKGRFIRLVGQVIDETCVPVSDAMVEIWHPNKFGVYKYETSRFSDLYDKNFNESGSFLTNNLGRFEFLTIYPGRRSNPEKSGKEAPRIHMKVTHPDFAEVNTVIYFAEENSNLHDEFLHSLTESKRELLTAEKLERSTNLTPPESVYMFNVTLKGKNKHKRY